MNAEAAAFIVAGLVTVAAFLIGWGGSVYHGWFAASTGPVERARRRLYWRAVRPGTAVSWAVPAAVPVGVSLLVMAAGVWLISIDDRSDGGSALAVLGLLGVLLSMLLAIRRPPWLLARWHVVERERAAQGLGPLIPPPEDDAAPGPITRRDQIIGLALVLALAGAWWAFTLPFFVLLLAIAILWILATTAVRDA
jgi:hypothetical protein